MHLGHMLLALVASPWCNWPAMSYQRVGYRKRLTAVQEHFAKCLDEAPAGPVRVVSLCAGDGRDVMRVLPTHPRRGDVKAWLVELDGASVAAGREQRAAAGLEDIVTFVHGDATDYATYWNILPCDVVLVCGVLGHVRPDERSMLVKRLTAFCKPGGHVIWTRGVKRGMARHKAFKDLFEGYSFERAHESITPDGNWGVSTYRYIGPEVVAPTKGRVFHFERKAGRNS
jgi:Putative methyltransferase